MAIVRRERGSWRLRGAVLKMPPLWRILEIAASPELQAWLGCGGYPDLQALGAYLLMAV